MTLDRFSPAVREWFEGSFDTPTRAQELGWPAIASGDHTLLLAPTGSGKTLAAFLWALDRLTTDPLPTRDARCRVLYISPLRALAVDIERNLRAPLHGITLASERLGSAAHPVEVGIRTGDTPASERRTFAKKPPDILITTPESLFLMLTSNAREALRGVRSVIIDEIHAMAGTKRGAHLMLSLERLEELTGQPPQRIGLSATQRPLEEIARFLGGQTERGARPVTVVDAGSRKALEIDVVVPVEDMGKLGGEGDELQDRFSIWPSVYPKLLEKIYAHRSTLIFVNARRLAERLAAQLNERAGEDLVKAHHGSISREQRLQIEDDLKAGRVRALVATSSLELGIDMGAIDLVIQVESPGSVARGLQRIGRAGHRAGEVSKGTIFPKFRGDLIETAVVVSRMKEGLIEETHYPRQPLDVLAQQIVAMCSLDEWNVEDLKRVVRRSANFEGLSDDLFDAVLDLLSGRYPSDEFAELRPRVVWDRTTGALRARAGAQRLAVTSGGTIPDRGLYGVFLPDGVRVGELDEEMVYESRTGEVFVLGASAWRIEEITHDRVVVTPAPGQPGKMPFWHGDHPGRDLELSRAIGAFVRGMGDTSQRKRLTKEVGLNKLATKNLVAYLAEQQEATGAIPDDRTIVVERSRDEIGDWRICILSPFGARVHAPWALAIEHRLTERLGQAPQMLWSDDGIVIRLPEAHDRVPMEDVMIDPEEIEDLVVRQLPGTPLFGARFRECAARALLIPRRRPGQRTPLWQQRQRAADLLTVAAGHPTFPILLETTRECMRDVFDVPGLRSVLADIRARRIRAVPVDTDKPSPFARSLLFGWVANYLYEGDAPLAERRAAALALDPELLRELLGSADLRELLDPDALDELALELQCLTERRRARDADEVHDILRTVGDLTRDEILARSRGDFIDELLADRRAITLRVASEERIIAAEDSGRYRDALGLALPQGLPAAFTESSDHAWVELVSRYARTHAPFVTADVARRFGVSDGRVVEALTALEHAGRVVAGEFRPGAHGREWCDDRVLRTLRRRSLAALRKEIEPVDASVLGRFLPTWHGIGANRRGADALLDAVAQLQGTAIPASILEHDVLPSRVGGYRPADLDALCASGHVVWTGAGAVGADDGRVTLFFRDQLTRRAPDDDRPNGPVHDAIRGQLGDRGASFWSDLVTAVGTADPTVLLTALWDLVWSGEVTNDTLAPLRAFVRGKMRARTGKSRPRPGRLTVSGPPAGAGRWSLVPEPRSDPTEQAHATALSLLDRHGVLTREAVRAEGVPGGFAGVYTVLRAMEESGRVRRGYFVAGLGAAQFALPGAVDRLRAIREEEPGGALALAACDPANPYGAALEWPSSTGRPARGAGAYVILSGGEVAAFLERGARSLVTFPAATNPGWEEALASLAKDGKIAKIELTRIDGLGVADSLLADRLRAAGFTDGYRGLVLRG